MPSRPINPWTVLDLACTRDPRAIRRAYAARLRTVDPAVDIEGFQLLNEAYRWALAQVQSADRKISGDETETHDAAAAESPKSPAIFSENVEPANDLSVDRIVRAPLMAPPPDSPAAIAEQTLDALSGIDLQAQFTYLWNAPDLVSLLQREAIECELLLMLIHDFPRWKTCIPALEDFFSWSEPILVRGDRDSLLRDLFHQWRQLDTFEIAEALLRGLGSIQFLGDRLQWLRDHPVLQHPLQAMDIELATLRLVLAQPGDFAKAAWALLLRFRWTRPERVDSERSLLLTHLLHFAGAPWKLCLDAAVEDLIAELREPERTRSQRDFLDQDPRLSDLQWRHLFEAQLRAYCVTYPGASVRAPLIAHFGWSELPAAPASPQAEEAPLGLAFYLVALATIAGVIWAVVHH